MKGISWPVSSDKWKAPLASMYQTKYDSVLWWPTTVTAKPKTSPQKQNTSRQNQKPHDKNKIPHGKTKNLTAKTKYLTAKPKTSRQNQILHSKNKIALVLPWVFAFFHSIWFCREIFGFAVTVVRYSLCQWRENVGVLKHL